LVPKLINEHTGRDGRGRKSGYNPRVQEELNKSIGKGLVKDRLAKAKDKMNKSVPSMFSSFDF